MSYFVQTTQDKRIGDGKQLKKQETLRSRKIKNRKKKDQKNQNVEHDNLNS